MKITIGDVNFYELDLDTDDSEKAREMAIDWLRDANGHDKFFAHRGCAVVQESGNGILVKIEEKYHD